MDAEEIIKRINSIRADLKIFQDSIAELSIECKFQHKPYASSALEYTRISLDEAKNELFEAILKLGGDKDAQDIIQSKSN